MRPKTILIVDDEKNTREGISKFLRLKDFHCLLAEDGKQALAQLKSEQVDLMLTDLRMPVMGGMDLLLNARSIAPDTPIVVLTAYGSVESAVEAVKRGAADFLTKPINLDKLLITISRILDNIDLKEENTQLQQRLDEKYGLQNIIGTSEKMQKVFDLIRQVAPSKATVLIQGESGTGKELVAHAIHQLSPRKSNSFVAVHCASLAGTLLESELFGHEKGAFTGAVSQRVGRFELADRGTLFLDEVSEISLPVQVKLLRVLQEQSFERVGGIKTIPVDIRLIAASNKNLEQEVNNNEFREDLYYRLNVVTIQLPPLRERKEDIPLLIKHYLDLFVKENNRSQLIIDPQVVKILQNYNWPGNIRELRNCIENMVVLTRGDQITIAEIPDKILTSIQNNSTSGTPDYEPPASEFNIKDTERSLIIKAIKENNGNRTKAAEALGFSRRTLYRKLEKYGLE